MKKSVYSAFLGGMLLAATSVQSAPITDGLGGWVDFSMSGTQLRVELRNVSSTAAVHPTDVLTAVFFSCNGGLTPVSAITGSGLLWLGASSSAFNNQNVGGEWAYASALTGLPDGATRGISSTGIDRFGAGNFNGSDLWGPPSGSVDGLQGGLVSAAYGGLGQGGDMQGNQLVSDRVIFLFNVNNGFNISSIDDVSFLYGTSLGEGSVPDGGLTIALLGLGLVGIGALRNRFSRA